MGKDAEAITRIHTFYNKGRSERICKCLLWSFWRSILNGYFSLCTVFRLAAQFTFRNVKAAGKLKTKRVTLITQRYYDHQLVTVWAVSYPSLTSCPVDAEDLGGVAARTPGVKCILDKEWGSLLKWDQRWSHGENITLISLNKRENTRGAREV